MPTKRVLEASDLDRLSKLCGLFSSDHDGERANAAGLADRFLRDRGWRWTDVLTAPSLSPPDPPAWQSTVAACRARPDRLSAWELDFLAELATYRHPPSGKQADILARIAARVARP
jgi:hypothetical protein